MVTNDSNNPQNAKKQGARVHKKRFILAFSGGKDSTYLLLELLERKMPLDEIRFNDCGLEYPAVYEWLNTLERRLGVKISRYKSKLKFDDLFFKKKVKGSKKGQIRGFPPTIYGCWVENLIKLQAKPNGKDEVIYLGICADEAHRKPDNPNRLTPLITWGVTGDMILARLRARGFMPPYYELGFKRGGCWLCPKQPRTALYLMWKHYPKLWKKLKWYEKKSPWGFKDGVILSRLEGRFKEMPEKYEPEAIL